MSKRPEKSETTLIEQWRVALKNADAQSENKNSTIRLRVKFHKVIPFQLISLFGLNLVFLI